jgi:hypothetical protein
MTERSPNEWIEMPLSQLDPNPKNPRMITGENLRRLRRSVRRFDLVENLVWNRRTKRLVGGHQRMRVLRALNREKAMVCVVDIDEEEEAALMIQLNNPHAQGEFSEDLKKLLDDLQDFDSFDALGLDQLGDFDDDMDLAGESDESEEPDSGLTYSVIVDMTTEDEQGKLLQELEDRGYQCRLLIS